MKKYFLFFLVLIPLNFIISQDCYFGDCENGYGIKNYSDATYYGFWQNGFHNGLGFLKYQNGNAYVGEFKGDLFEGDGAYFMANGEKYFGEFKEGKQGGVEFFKTLKQILGHTSRIWGNLESNFQGWNCNIWTN